jgi:hypothetical protein
MVKMPGIQHMHSGMRPAAESVRQSETHFDCMQLAVAGDGMAARGHPKKVSAARE